MKRQQLEKEADWLAGWLAKCDDLPCPEHPCSRSGKDGCLQCWRDAARKKMGKMKLTQAQIKALQAVAKGKVELYEPHDMRKPIKIWGAHTGVITRLADAHLIKPVPTDSFTTKVFVLTEAGQKALETKND